MLRRRRGEHAKVKPFPWVRLFLACVVVSFNAGLFTGPSSHPAPVAAPAVHVHLDAATETLGDRLLDKAETQRGCWYSWAGAGPCSRGYDCSGLVVWSAGQLGIYVPHGTYLMLPGTSHLYRISLSQARRGDLMFYGSGHVEINTSWYHTTFGALDSGTRVGWHKWSTWWHPTMAMRIR